MEVIVFVKTRLRRVGCFAGTVSVRVLGRIRRVMFEFTLTEHHTSGQQLLVRKREKPHPKIFLNHRGALFVKRMQMRKAKLFLEIVLKGLGKTIARLNAQYGQYTQRETVCTACRYQCTVPSWAREIIGG